MRPEDITNAIIDAYVGNFILMWYWPNFVIGNMDTWQKLGVTMNGIRTICDTK